MKEIIDYLIKNHLTISTMESCTGGALVNEITNIEGSSEVIKFSAVTYSNEYKIKMGIDEDIINKYSVYSIETAMSMANNISKFANSDIGIGVTGKINRGDENNKFGKDNEVFFSIYYNNKYYNYNLLLDKKTREDNKKLIIEKVEKELKQILL